MEKNSNLTKDLGSDSPLKFNKPVILCHPADAAMYRRWFGETPTDEELAAEAKWKGKDES